jgi:hypothetical protein
MKCLKAIRPPFDNATTGYMASTGMIRTNHDPVAKRKKNSSVSSGQSGGHRSRKQQIEQRVPDDFDELPEEEQHEIIAGLEDVVASVDPAALRAEITSLTRLIDQARILEKREIESKLTKLKSVLKDQGFFSDPAKKLLLFTEHKDSLDFLVGDGKDNRPHDKLREWGLTFTQIHGGMKIGDRDTPGTRIYSKREFRGSA